MEQTPPLQRPQNPLSNYQFSSDELRVLRECNSESFFQRSLPLGTVFGVGAYMAVRNGHLRPNIKYGAVPKVVMGVILGYFMGKFSYQQKCAEKLMRLPNSRLAELLKQRKQGGVMGSFTPDMGGMALSPFTPNAADVYSDEDVRSSNRGNALNLDLESRPAIAGLDDIYRPSLDSPISSNEPELPIEPAKPGTSYEDLRKHNREEYMKKQQNPYSRPLPSDAPVVMRPRSSESGEQESALRKGQTNKYGDTWTE